MDVTIMNRDESHAIAPGKLLQRYDGLCDQPSPHVESGHEALGQRTIWVCVDLPVVSRHRPSWKLRAGNAEIDERGPNDTLPCLGIVMPVFNEAGTIAEVVRRVLAQPVVQQLIIVDDASADGTWELVQPLSKQDGRVRLLRHERNQGKGAALRTGFSKVTAPVVLIQDADLEYNPAEYPRMLKPILDGKADVVFGSRFVGSGSHRVLYYWHSVGNKILTTLSNMATNLNLTDLETCYKMFRRQVIEQITVEEDRFGFEPEITAKLNRLGVRIYEIDISYHGRTYAEGKKVGWRDGLGALWCILKYNFFR